MNTDPILEMLQPEIDRQLDELLLGWRQTSRLDDAQVEHIRQEILFTGAELPAGWWSDYWQRLNATFERSNRMQQSAVSTIQLQRLNQLSNQIGWTPRNAAQWQPYLKVA